MERAVRRLEMGETLCPKDLIDWVQKEKLDSVLYDIELLPEQITNCYKVCALRGFQYGWMSREKLCCNWRYCFAQRSFWKTECGYVADDPAGEFCPHCGKKITRSES